MSVPRGLRDLDGQAFNATTYNRWSRAKFNEGVAHGREEARKDHRKAIAKPLRELRREEANHVCTCKLDREFLGKAGPCATCKVRAAIRAIDAATRAPRRRSK